MTSLEAFVMYTIVLTATTVFSVTYSKLTNRAWLIAQWAMAALGGVVLFIPGMDNSVSQGLYVLSMVVLVNVVHLTYSLDNRTWRVGYSTGTALCIAAIAYALYPQVDTSADVSWLLVILLAFSPFGFFYKRSSIIEGYGEFLKAVGAKNNQAN